MLGAMLEQASGVEFGDSDLTLRFAEEMAAVRRQLEQRDSVELLQREASRIAGRKLRVGFEVGRAAPTVRNESTVSSPAAETAPPAPQPASAPSTGTGPAEARDLLEDARREPGVRMLLDAFGAHVVDIRRQERPEKQVKRGKAARPTEETP